MGAPNPDVAGLVSMLALQYWTPANTPDLSAVVASVTAQLPVLGGVITPNVVAFAQGQVQGVFTAQEATEAEHGGPSPVASIPTITPFASYTVNAGQALPRGVATIVNFSTKVEDTDNAVTTGAGWKFTVPAGKGGLYLAMAGVEMGMNVTTTRIFLEIFKNAVGGAIFYSFSGFTVVGGGRNNGWMGSTILRLVPGDLIDFRALLDDSAADGSVVGANYMQIARIGL